MPAKDVRYDIIGKGYNTTRKADPYLTSRIYELLRAQPGKKYVDIGCGTGNYLTALSQKGLSFYGVDPSATMLQEARAKKNDAQFFLGAAEDLPFEDRFFEGAIAILTIHHWNNIEKGFKEIKRVLKPGSNFVCMSFTTQQSGSYWLNHYFPKMMERTFYITPEKDEMEDLLIQAGFSEVCFENYFVHDELEDHFLYSSKNKPERYLIPEIRNNTSAFSYYANDPEEINTGLKRLEEDIQSGNIRQIIRDHENQHGDYIFVTATV